ncbi:hypothetical protein Scep_017319 [Stephania cephalantha]|uniref:Uncharacterized protein n=1 Tax=Stephania cephalantha TaxID=152367 RepID=A0AAP0IPB0_9MAGN
MYTVSPLDRERYYLRLLLNHVRGPISFEDLRTVDGFTFETFKQSAEKRGLLEDDDSVTQCLREAANVHMPRSLRRLFATILVFCEPIRVRDLWDEFNTYMIEDYKNANKNDHSLDESFFLNCCLKDLTNYLSQHQKNITDYDLPQPTSESITNINKFIVEEKSIKISKEDLDSIRKLNKSTTKCI